MHMMNDPQQHQQFCLRWNNHSSTLVAVFDNLLSNESLVDVTLFAEGKLLRAHRVVLSACSPYFQTLFAQTNDKHPIVILKDVKYDHLKALLDYMYRGEVNISQDQLGPLIKTAESLKIKGLADGSKEDGEVRSSSLTFPLPKPPKQSEPSTHMPSPPSTSLDIKPRVPPLSYPSANSAPSVLSTALTMPPALSLSSSLNLPHMPNLPASLASNLASSLTTSIPHSMPSTFPHPHNFHSRLSDCDSPHAKKRKKHRRLSGEGVESPESDCPSSGSPGDSVSNFHLPRIPATITPISHSPHHLGQPQQHPKDLSSHSSQSAPPHHSHNNHHESNHSHPPLPPLPVTASHSLPPVPPVAHLPTTIPMLLPTTQHSLNKTQDYPEDLKQHFSLHLHPESHHNSRHSLHSHNTLSKVNSPIASRDNHEDRSGSPSPPLEMNCSSSRISRRDDEQKTESDKHSPGSKLGSDPESQSPLKGPLQAGKATDDTSSDNNHYSEDEGDDTSNERPIERASDYSMGPSTSRPHSEEAAANPNNYLNWPVYPESSSAEDSFANLPDNPANQGFWKNSLKGGLLGSYLGSLTPSPRPHVLTPTFPGLYPGAGSPSWTRGSSSPPPGLTLSALRSNECSRCGRLYKTRKGLKHHIKNECGVEPRFQCSHCDWKFKQKAHLLRHMARKHTIS